MVCTLDTAAVTEFSGLICFLALLPRPFVLVRCLLEVRQKYSAARRIFNSLLGVSSGDETLHLMFDILHDVCKSSNDSYRYL